MIGDDGISRCEVVLDRDERDFLRFVMFKYKCDSRTAAIRVCIRMVQQYFADPENPENPEALIKGMKPALGE